MTAATTPHVRFPSIDGVRIRYADSGSPQKPAVVLTSPWPESVYAFAPMWASLAEHARLFAVDLPGFRRIRAPGRPAVSASDGRVPGPAHCRGGSGRAAHRRARPPNRGRRLG